MRRRIEAERGSIFGGKRGSDVIRAPLPATDHRQAARHRPHLVMEKAARCGMHMDLIADARDL